MEDSEKNDFSSSILNPISNNQPRFESKLDKIDEIPSFHDKYSTISHTTSSKLPPKSVRKNNVAVGGHTATNYNNLSLYGHK